MAIPLAIVCAVLFVAVIVGFVLHNRSEREAGDPTRVLTNSTYTEAGGGGGGDGREADHNHDRVWSEDSKTRPRPSPTYASIEDLAKHPGTDGSSVRDSVRLSMDLTDFALPGDQGGDHTPRPAPLSIAEDGPAGSNGPPSATGSKGSDFDGPDGYLNIAAVEPGPMSPNGASIRSSDSMRSETAF